MSNQINHPVLQKEYETIIDWMVENTSEELQGRVLMNAGKIYTDTETLLAFELARIRLLDKIKMG